MSRFEVSTNSLLALKVATHALALVLVPTRQWILRHRKGTSGSLITTVSIFSFLVVYIGCGGLVIIQCIYERDADSRGLHGAAANLELLTVGYFQRLFSNSIIYTCLLWLLKIAFLGYFSNLIEVLTRRARVFYTLACIYVGASFITTLGVQIFYCFPVQTNWSLKADQCIHFKELPVAVVHAMLNLTSDLFVLVVAIVIIASLNLTRLGRYALIFVTGVGSISIIMCAVRFWETYRAITNPAFAPLQVVRQLTFWANLEVFIALVAFCAPAFRMLVMKNTAMNSTDEKRSKGVSGGSGSSWGVNYNGSGDYNRSVDYKEPETVVTRV